MKKLLALALCSMLALSLAACGGGAASTAESAAPASSEAAPASSEAAAPASSEAAPAQSTTNQAELESQAAANAGDVGDLTVALMVKNLNNQFFVELAEGAQEVADKYGWTLQLLAPVDTDSNEQQIQLIEQCLVNPPDIYVIIPTDSEGIVPAIEEINDAGIPVINLNTQIVGDVDLVTFVRCDNFQLGHDCAKAGAELVGNKGKAVMLTGVPGSQNFIDRIDGATAAFNEAGGIEILETQIANSVRDEAYTITQSLLQKYDDLQIIFSANGEMGLGAAVAVEEAGRQDEIKIFATDCTSEVVQAVADGRIAACIDNAADFQGRYAMELVMQYEMGEDIPADIKIDSPPVTLDNVAEYLEKYGLN